MDGRLTASYRREQIPDMIRCFLFVREQLWLLNRWSNEPVHICIALGQPAVRTYFTSATRDACMNLISTALGANWYTTLEVWVNQQYGYQRLRLDRSNVGVRKRWIDKIVKDLRHYYEKGYFP